MTPTGPRERGFTAIEVLIAVVLLATGLLATAQLFVVASAQGRLAKQGSDASTIAAHTIERYRDMDYAKLPSGTDITSATVGGDSYTVQSVVTKDPQTNMADVTVTVTWNGGTQKYVSETILSNLQ